MSTSDYQKGRTDAIKELGEKLSSFIDCWYKSDCYYCNHSNKCVDTLMVKIKDFLKGM